MSAQPERRPIRVSHDEEHGYSVALEGGGSLWGVTEEELRWLGLVLIPAALPPMPVPGLERG